MKGCKVSMIVCMCIFVTGCGIRQDLQLSEAIKRAEQNGYTINAEDKAVITKIRMDDYRCERVSIDYSVEQYDKYQHKEDYFYFYNTETGELWDIIHYEVSEHDIGEACEFGVQFDDINFDGHQDLLIENGNDRGGSSYYNVYLWAEDGFFYEKTFEGIGNYQLDFKTESIIGYQHVMNYYDIYTYFRYTNAGYQSYKNEYKYNASFIQAKVENLEKKQVIYSVQINPQLPICRIEVIQADNNADSTLSLEGVDFEIKIYPDQNSKEGETVIHEKLYDLPSLELKFEDLDFDGTADMMIHFANGIANMSCYNIYFGQENGYSEEKSIKEFMCSSYVIYEDQKLFRYRFMGYADSLGKAWEDTLCYFKEGKIIPVRTLFYKEEPIENGDLQACVSVLANEDGNEIELYSGTANNQAQSDKILQEGEHIFNELIYK